MHDVRRNVTVYEPTDRPDVEVLVDGEWLPGEARMRWQDDQGGWWYQVQWRPPGTHTRRLDNFPADRLRTPLGAQQPPREQGVSEDQADA